MHHHHHHHSPHHHHHHHRPPPPPPPLPEVLDAQQAIGEARCYFCGQGIREDEIRKTKYHVGHGHKIVVMIRPDCKSQGVDTQQNMGQIVGTLIAILVFICFIAGGYFFFVKPSMEEHERFRKESERRFEEFNKKHGLDNWP